MLVGWGLQFWMYDPVLVDKSSPGWGNYSQDQVGVRVHAGADQ